MNKVTIYGQCTKCSRSMYTTLTVGDWSGYSALMLCECGHDDLIRITSIEAGAPKGAGE